MGHATDWMEDFADSLENIRKAAYCKINPKGCGDDPAEEPFDPNDFTEDKPENEANICPAR